MEGVLKIPLVEYVELLIPCILHLENRVGEKILTMILRKGLELWSEGPRKRYIETKAHLPHLHTGCCHMRGEMTPT